MVKIQMELGKLPNVLKRVMEEEGEQPKAAFFTSFSANPLQIMKLLRHCGLTTRTMQRNVFVFFQRYSFREMDPTTPPGPAFVGEKRKKEIRKFERKRKYRAFRIKSTSPVKNQLHLKSAIFLFREKLVYVQFSRNLDLRSGTIGENDEVIYTGLPQNLDDLLVLLQDVLEKGEDFVEDMDNGADAAMAKLEAMRRMYRRPANIRQIHRRDYLVVQGFRTSFGHEFGKILRRIKHANGPGKTLYNKWAARDDESVLLLHFPYVTNGLETNVCDAVVAPMSVSTPEKTKTSVELTYSRTPNLQHFPHESWVCRMTGRGADARVLWFFLVSSNLTLPSWVPLKRNDGNGVDMTRYNLECGVVSFEHQDVGRNTNLSIEFVKYIRNLMKPGDWSTLTTVKCNVDRSEIPVQVPDLPLVDEQCQATYDDCFDAISNPRLSNQARFQNAKTCLLNGYLVGLVGASTVVNSKIMKNCYYMRWALYDYLFNDLGKHHPVQRLEAYDERTTKRYFVYELQTNPEGHPWLRCANAKTTLDVLVDMYVRWANAFDAYDERINASRPVVNRKTLVTLHDARCEERIVEDAHQKFRPKHTPYDTLSFLMQSMYSSSSVWWKCSKGHDFYWTPYNMMLRTSACIVCAMYHDIKALYELLQLDEDVSCLTSEFPLLRRTPSNKAEEQELGVHVDGNANDVERDSAKERSLMRYDIFFLLDGKYACAIEFDDASHNKKAPNLQNLVMDRPSADAAKNVLSTAMGIHLLRIWAQNKRPNAKARLSLLLKTFLAAVRERDVVLEPTSQAFASRITGFEAPNGLFPKHLVTALTGAHHPSVEARQLEDRIGKKVPVSFVFATDVPDLPFRGTEKSLMTEMQKAGKKHPCLSLNSGVKLQRQLDPTTKIVYYNMLQEWKTRQMTPLHKKAFQVAGGHNPRGRLMSQFDNGYNGLALIGGVSLGRTRAAPTTMQAYVLESKNIEPWRMVPQPVPRGNYDLRLRKMRSIAQQYVRIKAPEEMRPGGVRCGYPPDTDDNDDAWEGILKKQRNTRRDRGGGDDDANAPPPPPERPPGWPLAAQWALPFQKIDFRHPDRIGEEYELENPGHWLAGSSTEAVVQRVEIQGGQHGVRQEWWMAVKRHPDGPSRWIPQSEFKYVFRSGDGRRLVARRPLSDAFPNQGEGGVVLGRERERRPSWRVRDSMG